MTDSRIYSVRELKLKAVFMAIVAAVLLVALAVLNRVSLGWFTTNRTVTATGAVAIDGRYLDVNILEAYKNYKGDGKDVNLATEDNLLNGIIPAENFVLGDSMTYILEVTNKTPQEKFNDVAIYIAIPTGVPEQPYTVTENGTTTYYWLSSQLIISNVELVDGDESKFFPTTGIENSALFAGGAQSGSAGTTSSTAKPNDVRIATLKNMVDGETITITVTITFANSSTINQDAYKSFGSEGHGRCRRIFLISY